MHIDREREREREIQLCSYLYVLAEHTNQL